MTVDPTPSGLRALYFGNMGIRFPLVRFRQEGREVFGFSAAPQVCNLHLT